MIRVIDYGVGNIQAFLNLYSRLGIPAQRARSVSDLSDASHLILPGVGSFDHAMNLFNQSGMRTKVEALIFNNKIPLLGVCVGMQMLSSGSDEGVLPGLGWVPGKVRAFAQRGESCKLPMPHMGWNDIQPESSAVLFQDFCSSPKFYFLHSYYFDSALPHNVSAKANYGFDFDCAVSAENIHGIQCHPEKSHHFGEKLLSNFSKL